MNNSLFEQIFCLQWNCKFFWNSSTMLLLTTMVDEWNEIVIEVIEKKKIQK